MVLVGGVGVFFPGPDGFASYEQNFVSASDRGTAGPQSNSDRLNAPRVLEAEFIAYFAAGGTIVGPGATPVTEFEGAVSDSAGEVLGLYRMHDATIFSIDVAVAKSRNTAYYASSSLQDADRIDFNNDNVSDIPIGTALTNRTFRFLALPRYPSGSVEGTPPGDFSILTMPGINPLTGENTGAALPASVYASKTATVLSFDSFNASRNFRDPRNIKLQNGIEFFPGSSALYDDVSGTRVLVGGLGVSGDGVDQDDVVTVGAQLSFEAPDRLRSDQFVVAGVRLPYQNFNRNPRG